MGNPLQLSIVSFKKGAYITVEGKQRADYFYIIRTGNVRISKEVEVVEEEGGNLLGPGDFFGVISTMSNHSHIETAQAVTEVSMIAVHRDQYGLLIKNNAPVAMKIIQGFSRKMRYMDEALTRLTLKSTAAEEPGHLFKVAEYYARQSQYNQAYYAYHRYIQCCPNGINIKIAKERMAKIHPYAKAVHLDPGSDQFTRQYPPNTMIFSESEPGQELYIIQQGKVKITKIVNDNEVMLAILKQGDIFGEMSLLENRPRSASAISYENSVLLAVNLANFKTMVSSQPQMITRLTQLLAERLWFVYKQLANTQLVEPIAKVYDALFIQLEKIRMPITTGASYTFDFGPKELMNMIGLSAGDGQLVVQKLLENNKFKLLDNKLHSTDVEEIEKQASYYRKIEKIQKSRQNKSFM